MAPAPIAAPAARSAPARNWIGGLLSGASIELSARDPLAGPALRELFQPGAAVFINFPGNDTHHGVVQAAVRLRRAGFEPVPHVAARYLLGYTQLNDFLARVAGEAGAGQALVVGGDAARPAGSYRDALQLIDSGLFQKHGILRLHLAGYPQGHPRIGVAELDGALRAKLRAAKAAGLETSIVTQFDFEAEPILAWLRRLRGQGIDAPVRVGLAGPTSVATLSKFAVRCGVGNTLRALASGHTSFARLLTEVGPEPLVHALARACDAAEADGADLGIAGLHFFTFGGAGRTAAMIRTMVRGEGA